MRKMDFFRVFSITLVFLVSSPCHSETAKIASSERVIVLRDGGDDEVDTYRIPGLATTTRGTLIAVYDVRHRSSRDLPGDIDVGMSRSTDGGRTWSKMKIIIDMGDDPKHQYGGVGDPCVLVDRVSGTIWCAGLWSHGNRAWRGSGPGMSPNETGQMVLVKSDDDGLTWSEPFNITSKVKDPKWSLLLQGPGKGITMSDSTLVFPVQFQDPPSTNDARSSRLPQSAIIFSRDQGLSWDISKPVFDDTTEAQVVELTPGELMLNCRYNRGNSRVVMTTRDMGKNWVEHSTSRNSLIEPRSCMASIINVGHEISGMRRDTSRGSGSDGSQASSLEAAITRNSLLLFSNPNSTTERSHLTIKASLDGGNTWPSELHLLIDEGRSAGYSCMSMIDSKTVGILYEGSQADLCFQRVNLMEIVNR